MSLFTISAFRELYNFFFGMIVGALGLIVVVSYDHHGFMWRQVGVIAVPMITLSIFDMIFRVPKVTPTSKSSQNSREKKHQ